MADDDDGDEGGEESGDDESSLLDPIAEPIPESALTGDPLTDAIVNFLRVGSNPESLLRQIALQTLGPRSAGIQESLLQKRRLASGSTRETFAQISDQINQLQGQLQSTLSTIGRQGGFSAGGQREILQERALAQSAGQLSDLFNQAALSGNQQLLQVATGVTPLTATQIPPAQTSVQSQPFNTQALGQLLSGLPNILNRAFPPTQPLGLGITGNPNLTGTTLSGTPLTGAPLLPPATTQPAIHFGDF
jgi:hypothetical protein